jgi:predicted small metal-binding protein
MVYEFVCADAGFDDCEFEIRDEDREELVRFVQNHGRKEHDIEASESEVEGAIHSV